MENGAIFRLEHNWAPFRCSFLRREYLNNSSIWDHFFLAYLFGNETERARTGGHISGVVWEKQLLTRITFKCIFILLLTRLSSDVSYVRIMQESQSWIWIDSTKSIPHSYQGNFQLIPQREFQSAFLVHQSRNFEVKNWNKNRSNQLQLLKEEEEGRWKKPSSMISGPFAALANQIRLITQLKRT